MLEIMEAESGLSEDVRRLATAVAAIPKPESDVVALWNYRSNFPGDMGRHQAKKSGQAMIHGNRVARLTDQLARLEKEASNATERRGLVITEEIAKVKQIRDEEWALLKQTREDDSPERLLAELMGRRGIIAYGEKQGTIEALAAARREFDSLDPRTRPGYVEYLGDQALTEIELMESEAADFYPTDFYEADFIRLRQFTGYVLAESGVDYTSLPETG